MLRNHVTAVMSATIFAAGGHLLVGPTSVTADVTPSAVCPPDETCAAPTMDFERSVVRAGERVQVLGTARAGVAVTLHGYSRPATAYSMIGTSTADAAGEYVFVIAPTTNRRLLVQSVDGSSASEVLLVRPRVSLAVTGSAGCRLTAAGSVFPHRASIPVDVGYRSADGRFVRAMTTRTTTDGRYSIGRVFGSCGSTLVWQARTPPSFLNDTGLSPVRSGSLVR